MQVRLQAAVSPGRWDVCGYCGRDIAPGETAHLMRGGDPLDPESEAGRELAECGASSTTA
jgi:hypothetical protein